MVCSFRSRIVVISCALLACGGCTSAADDSTTDYDGSPVPIADGAPGGIDSGGPTGDYEGYGAVTGGAESCPQQWTEVHVVSLADNGPGTLREAVSDGCRLILFDIGGTITLETTLNIRYSYITIDGASAPPPGITIAQAGYGTTIEARPSTGPVSDVLIHHIRYDGQSGGAPAEVDVLGIDGQDERVSRILIDHCTLKDSRDGLTDIYGEVSDVTLSWNLLMNTEKMMHISRGTEVQERSRISIHHNVFFRNNERQVRIRHDSLDIDLVNNVVYGWGWFVAGARGLNIHYDAGEQNATVNVIGNVYHHVPGLDGDADDALDWLRGGGDEAQVYFEGNVFPSGESDHVSNTARHAVPAEFRVTEYPADTLGTAVVPHVGTHYPLADEELSEVANALTN